MKLPAFIVAFLIFIFASGAPCNDVDNAAKAKEHFLKGKAFVEEGQYEEAIAELKTSYDLNPVPIVLYNIAVCYDDKLHRYADASKYYSLYLEKSTSEPQEKKQSISDRLKEISKYLGQLVIQVDVEGVEVIVDDQPESTTLSGPIALDAGEHALTIRKTGYSEVIKKFTVTPGNTTKISISMSSSEMSVSAMTVSGEAEVGTNKTDSKTQPDELTEKEKADIKEVQARKKMVPRPVFWSLIGLTGAATIITISTGAAAIEKDKKASGMFTDEPGYDSVRKEGKRLALTTDVFLGITACAAFSSVVTAFFTDFKKEKKTVAHVSPLIDGQAIMLGFHGEF
jgi:hypothetical protein